MKSNIFSIQSTKGVYLNISRDGLGKTDLNQLLVARNLCYTAIERITEIIKKEYPLER